MIRIFALHSAYGLATAAAALDGGLLDGGLLDGGLRDDEAGEGGRVGSILVPFNSARVPETAVGIATEPALRPLRDRFDRVEDLDLLIGPLHPSSWKPATADLPVLERLLRRAWGIGEDDIELFVQSPQVAPARTLMELFPGARITIVGDGLMTYAPMRVALPHTVSARIHRVVHADVVPGVRPLVASPHAEALPVPPVRFGAVFDEAAGEADGGVAGLADGTPTVLVLGQYLSALGLVSAEEELDLQAALIDRAADWNPARVVFKPHPSAPPLLSDAVCRRAEERGIVFAEYRGPLSAETLAERLDVRAVVAGFSTALPTVRALHGRDIGSAGTEVVLARLQPYENSNRIPVTIVDALTRPDSPYAEPARLQHLVDAVGYAMQPAIAGHLRDRAVTLLRDMDERERDRYFTPERLLELRLPGAPRPKAVHRALRPAGGIGRIEQLRLTALGARRRIRRAWKALRGR